MAFEHKALKGNWAAFRKNLEALNTALAKGNDTMPAVTNNVTGILGQVNGIVQDVEFMGKMLGNGSGDGSDEAEKPKEQPKTETAVQQPDPAPANPAPVSVVADIPLKPAEADTLRVNPPELMVSASNWKHP